MRKKITKWFLAFIQKEFKEFNDISVTKLPNPLLKFEQTFSAFYRKKEKIRWVLILRRESQTGVLIAKTTLKWSWEATEEVGLMQVLVLIKSELWPLTFLMQASRTPAQCSRNPSYLLDPYPKITHDKKSDNLWQSIFMDKYLFSCIKFNLIPARQLTTLWLLPL